MDVITLLNEKGGTAKTSTALALGANLAQIGYRVLWIDGDSQAHLTLSSRTKREDRLYHLLIENGSIDSVIVPVALDYYGGDPDNPTLYIIPSAEQTALLDDKMDVYALSQRLPELEGIFDMVVIDTSPKIGRFHIGCGIASKWLIYPTEMTYLPIQGLFSSLNHRANAIAEGYPMGEILGILPTRYSKSKTLQKQNYGALTKRYGEAKMFSPLRFLTAWEEAAQLRVPVNRLAYENDAAKEAERFTREVLTRIGVMANE